MLGAKGDDEFCVLEVTGVGEINVSSSLVMVEPR